MSDRKAVTSAKSRTSIKDEKLASGKIGEIPVPVHSLSFGHARNKTATISRLDPEKFQPFVKSEDKSPLTYSTSKAVCSKHQLTDDRRQTFRVKQMSSETSEVPKLSTTQQEIKLSIVDLAQQITLIELELFKAIKPEELSSLKWNGKQKQKIAPNIVASTRWFNQISSWAQKSILNQEVLEKRASQLSRFIRTAKKLTEKQNFGSAMAVVSALQMQCVHRLTATWDAISSRDRTTFRKVCTLLSQDNNFSNLRSALDNARLPCIPYLGLYLSDLTYIGVAAAAAKTRGSAKFTDEIKQERIDHILSTIERFQRSEYPYTRDEHVIQYLKAQRYVDELQGYIENAHYKLSLKLEPSANESCAPPPDAFRSPFNQMQQISVVSVASIKSLFETHAPDEDNDKEPTETRRKRNFLKRRPSRHLTNKSVKHSHPSCSKNMESSECPENSKHSVKNPNKLAHKKNNSWCANENLMSANVNQPTDSSERVSYEDSQGNAGSCGSYETRLVLRMGKSLHVNEPSNLSDSNTETWNNYVLGSPESLSPSDYDALGDEGSLPRNKQSGKNTQLRQNHSISVVESQGWQSLNYRKDRLEQRTGKNVQLVGPQILRQGFILCSAIPESEYVLTMHRINFFKNHSLPDSSLSDDPSQFTSPALSPNHLPRCQTLTSSVNFSSPNSCEQESAQTMRANDQPSQSLREIKHRFTFLQRLRGQQPKMYWAVLVVHHNTWDIFLLLYRNQAVERYEERMEEESMETATSGKKSKCKILHIKKVVADSDSTLVIQVETPKNKLEAYRLYNPTGSLDRQRKTTISLKSPITSSELDSTLEHLFDNEKEQPQQKSEQNDDSTSRQLPTGTMETTKSPSHNITPDDHADHLELLSALFS